MKTTSNILYRLSKSIVGEEEKKAVEKVLSIGYLGTGSETNKFEKEIEEFLNEEVNVVCTNTGTSALQLALQACYIGRGDEVLVPTLTFVASFQAISATGAKPIACDVEENTALIDLIDAKKKISSKTKAIMPVHYTGYMGDLNAVYKFALENSLRVIEDAAHAFGCTYNGKKIGSFGDVVCFSFDGIKNITSGEGGAVATKDKKVIQKIQDLRLLGVEKDSENRYQGKRSWEFDVKEQGWRYHMSDIMAAIGRIQLKRFDNDFQQKRKTLHKHYRKQLEKIEEVRLLETDINNVTPHIMVIKVLNGKRDFVREKLTEINIQTGIHYKPNHLLSFYANSKVSLPVAEKLYQELLSLPLHPDLEIDDINYICNKLKTILNNN
jgi:dTDP-4-amino-4,6-dideoxygalactose transaminase